MHLTKVVINVGISELDHALRSSFIYIANESRVASINGVAHVKQRHFGCGEKIEICIGFSSMVRL